MSTPHPSSACALARAFAVALVAVALSGCGTEAIVVSEAAMADRADARVVGWTADEDPRQVFSPEDEEVTLHVLFQFNYRAVYEWYRVEWIAPDGSPYQVVSRRTDFGSHRDLRVSLPIRGKMASRMPGVWRVRVWLRGRDGAPDRLLVSRLFRIAEPDEALRAAGLTPVDPPPQARERPLAAPAPTIAGAAPDLASSAAGASPEPDAGPPPPPVDVLPELPEPQRPAGAPAGVVAAPSSPGDAEGAAAAGPATRSPADSADVMSVSMSSRKGEPEPEPESGARFRRDFPGCPPLYYPPGPDCVEQAPQE